MPLPGGADYTAGGAQLVIDHVGDCYPVWDVVMGVQLGAIVGFGTVDVLYVRVLSVESWRNIERVGNDSLA